MIRIEGQDGEGVLVTPFEGTTVNGFSSPQFIPVDSPIEDAFLTFKKGGNNTVEIRRFMTEDDIVYKGGKQDDVWIVRGMAVGVDINAKTGNGDDFISVIEGSIGKSMKVNTGSGDDKVDILEPFIDNDFIANLGKGNDTIYMSFTDIGDDAKVKLGSEMTPLLETTSTSAIGSNSSWAAATTEPGQATVPASAARH